MGSLKPQASAMKMRFSQLLLATLFCAILGRGPAQAASPPNYHVREWTNTEGKTLTAEYLGTQGANVVLKLPNGTITPVPLAKFSPADNTFVKQNPLDYHAPGPVHSPWPAWSGWPSEVQFPMSFVDVRETPGEAGEFVYTTAHFRFRTDVNLGGTLMKDLAKVFELTYCLQSKSPFGILATPAGGLFEARLFGTLQQYKAAGGPAMTAGVYKPKEKVFLAPLDLMGVQPGPSGWRKGSQADYDPSTVVHELTHMLTNDMLDNLPVWVNEGYAEYIRCIPLESASFKVAKDKIKQGVVDRIVSDYEASQRHKVKLKGAERKDFLKGDRVPFVTDVAKVLQMTDVEWATGRAPRAVADGMPGSRGPTISASSMPDTRLPQLYRTAHLIVYYFIQIEGDKGVAKLRQFLDKNRLLLAQYHQYVADYSTYEDRMKAFMLLPGVKLTGGRIQYPANLVPPKAPEAPFTDPNQLKSGGLDALLGGESAQVVGKRIEAALRQNLEVNLRFVSN